MKTNISGVGVALITPFSEDGSVDYAALDGLIDYILAGGVDYLVVFGTTAETPTLTTDEKTTILHRIVERVQNRVPLVIGMGGNNTAELVGSIKAFDFTGISALLSVTPYYNKPSQEGIYQHYMAVADASPVEVILYNVPGRTGVNMTAKTTLRLAHDHHNIVAVKEASGNLSQVAYILRDRPADFKVISGDDNCTLPIVCMGGEGVISVAANCFPQLFTQMVHLAQVGEVAPAAQLHLRMMEAVDVLFEEGNPVGVKAALAHYGVIKNYLRLPLVASTEALNEKFRRLIKDGELK